MLRLNFSKYIKSPVTYIINRIESLYKYKRFEKQNNVDALRAINLISIAALMMSIYFLYADLTVINSIDDSIFKSILFLIHILSFITAALYIMFYKWFTSKINYKESKFSFLIPRIYTFLFVLVAAASSINAQRTTGNIDAYIIMVLTASVAFPFDPIFLLFVYTVNHLIFLVGISMLNIDNLALASKQINSTAAVLASLFLNFMIYQHKMNDFISKQDLEKSELNFRKLFQLNPYPLLITELESGKLIKINKKALIFFNLSIIDVEKFTMEDIYTNHTDGIFITEQLTKNGYINNHILECRIKGSNKWVSVNHELIDYLGKRCIITGITDITELKRIQDELSRHASIDPLTGALNRRCGIELLKNKLLAAKTTTLEFIVCFIDINDLKQVNDIYGHVEGDSYINTICNILRGALKEEDTLFRLSGDEFIIIFENKELSYVNNIWKDVLSKFHELNEASYKPYEIFASHGLFQFKSGMEVTLEEILDLADQEMYKEKSKHKKPYKL